MKTVKAPAIDTSTGWTGHEGINAMQSILLEKLEAAAAATAALRRAQYDAACARHELTSAVIQFAGNLPPDVLTVNENRLRRILFMAR